MLRGWINHLDLTVAYGLHHLAFHAASRDDVDRLYRLLRDMGATILDPPADYQSTGRSTTPCSSPIPTA